MIITGGIYKGRKLTVPDEKITRPTLSKVRMSVFNSLYSMLGDFSNYSFLDVFGGSGIMGIEALSRGFSKVTVYEINKKSANVIKNNYSVLGLKPNLIVGDSLKLISKSSEHYTVAYVDPPYRYEFYERVVNELNCDIIVIEHSYELNIGIGKEIKQHKYGNCYLSYVKKM